MSSGEWCLIESDPGVFSALIRDFGVEGVQVEEIVSLDKDSFDHVRPVHGLIFLFKCVEDAQPEGDLVHDSRLESMFFAKQVITNACATQAIVNLLLNVEHEDVKLGGTLSDFKAFTRTFDCTMKGLALSNSDVIRDVHNSFARQQIFEYDNSMPRKEEDTFHFIAYLPIRGRLYELDGIKAGPVDLGAVGQGDWLDVARSTIRRRISKYKEGEIHFNLMAVTSDRRLRFLKEIKALQDSLLSVESMETEETKVDVVNSEMSRLQCLVAEEDLKRERYRVENIRRKHNYLPFIIEMIKILAAQERLLPLVRDAKEKLKKKQEKKEATTKA